MTFALALFAILSSSTCHGASAEEPSRLTLTFEPAAESGAIMVSLFDSEAGYAGGPPVRQARVDVATGERSTVFADLKKGHYAIKAFHDVNGDGKLNVNPFGVPVEPVAFSNNARANMAAPGWASTRIAVAGAVVQTLDIR